MTEREKDDLIQAILRLPTTNLGRNVSLAKVREILRRYPTYE